ncbi:MAG: M15 family metallopeptidase [Simkaniaceae bacterium]|nr:M15 family metallopeptidase [Simkaniaceae bacterium]MCF7852502.1 M15 family metallopeptidase [Simkaniaceae bacterium]
MDLVDVLDINPTLILDVRYATQNNFMGKALYSHPVCFLRSEVAEALSVAQSKFQDRGLSLKIFDGYRPHSIQKQMFELFSNPLYVADPHIGSNHNRGAAVDVTLVDLITEEELEMPTGFDYFDSSAHSYYPDLPSHVLKNRSILQYVMDESGFKVLPGEWWHFDYIESSKFPILDISISDLIESKVY